MDEPQELHRMPRGDRCPECGSQRWYLQNGLRFCSRGHQIEGYVQFDVGDEEDSGKLGAISRREKAAQEKLRQTPKLSGQAGRDLYLEALQLIIRSQVQWLINVKEHREELETVVRDLWDLRTRGSNSIPEDSSGADELVVFSSAPHPEEANKTMLRRQSRRQDWNPDLGVQWPSPRVLETLVLCYLGCVLLRVPTSLGELLRWAKDGSIPYKRAYFELPPEIQNGLPAPYIRALKIPIRSPLNGDDLYRTASGLILSFHFNYSLIFPELNHVPVLVQAARRLALPGKSYLLTTASLLLMAIMEKAESVFVARKLSVLLGQRFTFPVEKRANQRLDHPEIRLIALLVIATKLCFPLNTSLTPLRYDDSTHLPRFDWEKWNKTQKEMLDQKQAESSQDEAVFDEITPGQVAVMTDDELDAYFSHISSLIDQKNENPITNFFPSDDVPTPGHVHDNSVEELDAATQNLLRDALEPVQRDMVEIAAASASTERYSHEAYRNVNQLTPRAAEFYKAASDVAGASLQTMVDAIYRVECALVAYKGKVLST